MKFGPELAELWPYSNIAVQLLYGVAVQLRTEWERVNSCIPPCSNISMVHMIYQVRAVQIFIFNHTMEYLSCQFIVVLSQYPSTRITFGFGSWPCCTAFTICIQCNSTVEHGNI